MPINFLRDLAKRIIPAWRQHVTPKLLPLISTIPIGGLMVAALSLWGFAEIADEVLEKETDKLDTSILLTIRELHTPLLDRIMLGITFLGEPEVLLMLCILAIVALLILNRTAQTTMLAIAGFGAIGLNYLLKDLFARTRPALWERILDVTSYSFPSGHAMISLVVYGAIGYLLASQFKPHSRLIFSLTIFVISAIGFSRLYLGVHWPTDVVAGYAAGVVWLLACMLSLEVWQRRKSVSVSASEK
ncbi:phosphatase PAP2 family protein [Planktothrix sp. FACHB-1355]|uniref:Phosphatase PAP2 family protein n=1 Tax=Aerosakkonema funiforme FACHB-1375 TaxID=2949571 RepID=A0A926VC93_9CYAN|nr:MULTISPECIES: phosphatase PAP2 family protein [Oscillatoriales]MBD2180237.1 phosphatase PAP2 family protein [Aerosakkonema funiforme FACHB-1375]MBD3559941.1 phosphatase PAP2 family protein [Planktothrix sp. FACHB-1355]